MTLTDLNAFTAQLSQLLQHPPEHAAPDHLQAVCNLLCAHLNATVRLSDIYESLADTGELHMYSHENLTAARNQEFTQTEKIAVQAAYSVIFLLLENRAKESKADKKRRVQAVRTVINSLSYSELEAATAIAKTDTEIIIAAKIAEKLNINRSVITSALRKLEGANLIETRSLGMKGTFVRIKDPLLSEELRKL